MKIQSLLSNRLKTAGAILLAVAATAFTNNAKAVSFDYASAIPSAQIVFDGMSHFSFTTGSGGNNFLVISSSAAGSLGVITAPVGGFTIGAITTSAGVSMANVTGVGSFVVHGPGGDLTATLTWVNIVQNGTAGNLNVTGTVNLTNIMYAGTDPTLQAFATVGAGANVLTFQFVPAVSLDDLAHNGTHSTSFSGTAATIPDGGATVVLLGMVFTGLAGLHRKMRARG